MCVYKHTHVRGGRGAGNLRKLALCFHHESSRDQTQVTGFGRKHLHLLNYLDSPPLASGFCLVSFVGFIYLFSLFVSRQDFSELRLIGNLTGDASPVSTAKGWGARCALPTCFYAALVNSLRAWYMLGALY